MRDLLLRYIPAGSVRCLPAVSSAVDASDISALLDVAIRGLQLLELLATPSNSITVPRGGGLQ